MSRREPTNSKYNAHPLALLLSYALLISLLSPFIARTAKAEHRRSLLSGALQVKTGAAHRDGELLIRFRVGVSEQEKNQIAGVQRAIRTKQLRGESGVERLSLSFSQDLDAAAAQLRSNPSVEFAEPNFIITRNDTTPNDARFNEQWALHNTGQSGGQVGSDIGATQAWDRTIGLSSTVIAVIDSGVDFSHPDLRNNEWANSRERQNGRDDDRDGFTDDVNGWDWVADSNIIRDEQGHGTAVAGIIAAEGNNGLGTTGVMWRANLMSLRVLDNTGTGSVADAVEAIDYAASHGAQIVNLSWGTDGESMALRDAIDRAGRRGVVVVCSAGNDGRDIDSTPYYPASYNLPNLIAVASTDQFDNLTYWSNYGPTHVHVAAPGTDILTTQLGGSYTIVTGTSASAPLVAGVAGLVKTLRPQLSASSTISVLTRGARRVAGLMNRVSSGGVVSASGSLAGMQAPGVLPTGINGNGNGNQGNNGVGNPNLTPVFHPDPDRGNGFYGTPAPAVKGAPAQNLPNLDELRKHQSSTSSAPSPVHATDYVIPTYEQGGDYTFAEGGADPDHSKARTKPINRTGPPSQALAAEGDVNSASQDFYWGIPLLDLKGRAGLDLELTLSYNSLVWTQENGYIQFNADSGFPAPGFKLGFPTVQQRFFNSDEGIWAYLLVTASGGRLELRQVGTSNLYESSDGSYIQLTDNETTKLVRTPDGTKYTFTPSTNNEFHCSQIEDRNGNFITIYYSETNAACITSITDTLGRVINFNYNSSTHFLESISQNWNGTQHDWAKFGYVAVSVQPNFQGLTVNGPNGNSIAGLAQVILNDKSYYEFTYNPYGQVYKVTYYGWDEPRQIYVKRNYTSINLPQNNSTPQSDCPKFSEKHVWAQNWNGNVGGEPTPSEEAVTYYSVDPNASWTMPDDTTTHNGILSQVTEPDGTIYKTYAHSSGWDNGLPMLVETYQADNPPIKQRWVTTNWTQDNTALSYPSNPRAIETNIYDTEGNRRRTTVGYYAFTLPDGASCSLPSDITEYDSDHTTPLRRTHTDYRLDSVYLNNRILGLPSASYIYDGNNNVKSKSTYDYDWNQGTGHLIATPAAPTQHDETNYGVSTAAGRGNLVLVQRWDATDSNNTSKIFEYKTGYYTTGTVAFTADPLWHKSIIEYGDNFSDGNNSRNTFAYPTALTDPDERWAQNPQKSLIQYNFDFGGVTRTQGLKPAGNTQGAIETITYDWAGRVARITNVNNDAYTRYVYGANYVQSFTSLTTNTLPIPEGYSFKQFDGSGRAFALAANHPGSAGGYTAQNIYFDVMGRLWKRSNPTEITGAWQPSGDDAVAGFVYTTQGYDWKGRQTVTTNPDTTTHENTYSGCGCAGGEVVTVRDEAGRRRKMTMDALGRLKKVEELNWNQTVYSTTNYTYNVLDQLTEINQQGQLRSMDYDGYGRLWHRTTPEQGATTYAYNTDDTISSVTDARGAKTIFGYNNSRHLVNDISYDLSGVLPGQYVAPTPNIHFEYDAVGNRTYMSDGLGSTSYAYDQLSRMRSETRTFTGVGSFTLTYAYNLSGELTSITNHWGAQATYVYDSAGRVTSVTGSGYPPSGTTNYINGISYRAFDAIRHINYSNGRELDLHYNNRLFLTDWTVGNVMSYSYDYNQFGENNTGRVTFAHNNYDHTLDRSFYYDQVGRLTYAYTGSEARATIGLAQWGNPDGPYAQGYSYDVWGNPTRRYGWGGSFGSGLDSYYSYTGNHNDAVSHDAAGNWATAEGASYDVTGQQVSYAAGGTYQSFDGDRLRVKKADAGVTTYYLRSTVLGGQVVCEMNSGGGWMRGYVYLGSELLAMQYNLSLHWVHQDPVTKSQRITDSTGAVETAVELDPWGGDTNRSSNQAFQPHRFTTYERDGDGGDDAMRRRYGSYWGRFSQPDPFDGSYNLTNPQSFNRYSYVQNDPVNFIDPSGLSEDPNGDKVVGPCPNGNCNVTILGGPYPIGAGGAGGAGGGGIISEVPEVDEGGGDEDEGPPDIDQLKKAFYDMYQKKLARCIWKVFGRDIDGNSTNLALFVQRQTIMNAPDVDMSRVLGYQGSYNVSRGRHGTVLISADLHGWTLNSGQVVSAQEQWFRTYAHELANLIADRRFGEKAALNLLGTREGIKGDIKGSTQTDYDVGARVEKCMFGNVSY